VIIIPAADQADFFAINVFQVRPENQLQLIDCIRDAGDPAGIPGLLSMHLLRSKDGTQEAFKRASAENPVIDATKTAIRQFIEGDGPRPHEVIEIKSRG
jgi:hypothetical protein